MIFIEENNSFKREIRDVPDKYHDCPEQFLGFLELLEHECTDAYDEKKYYFVLSNGKICWVERDENYVKTVAIKNAGIGFGLGKKAMEEFSRKIEDKRYY